MRRDVPTVGKTLRPLQLCEEIFRGLKISHPTPGFAINSVFHPSNSPFPIPGFLLDIAVYKGGERLYIVALNYRYSEKEES
jgi:hypothetical protein